MPVGDFAFFMGVIWDLSRGLSVLIGYVTAGSGFITRELWFSARESFSYTRKKRYLG
jgi:hypothetical protein